MKAYKTCPILKERIWGGQKLKDYNKKIGSLSIGESWETTGKDKLLPILIKLIDANDTLSVQVHPDEAYAKLMESQMNGKNEIWIILDCKEDSHIIYGLKEASDKYRLEKAIEDGTLIELLNFVQVRKGDCIYIPAGMIHTLGKGILAYEVQQTSDLTYRLYDWNRADSSGEKRELHIKKALDVIDYSGIKFKINNIYECNTKNKYINTVFENEFFHIRHFKCDSKTKYKFENSNTSSITITYGNAYIISNEVRMLAKKGDTWILPESAKDTTYIESFCGVEFIEAICNISMGLPIY